MLKRNYDFIVFDCDGVILRSNQIKSDAFATALEGEPDGLVADFVAYHKANGGVSRYAKFAHYYHQMQPIHSAAPASSYNSDALIKQAIARYASLVREQLMTCAMITGVQDFIVKQRSLGIPCAVNSGGDEQELHAVFQTRGLSPYFAHIFGSPQSKSDNMVRLQNAGFMAGKGVMFGDSRSDFDAAQRFALDFVLITEESEWQDGPTICAAHDCVIVQNFSQL